MAENSLFSRLQRLFTNTVIIKKIDKDKIRVLDFSKLQAGSNAAQQYARYGRMYKTNMSFGMQMSPNGQFIPRQQLYQEYDAMDRDSILSSVLDVYSEECTLANNYGDILTIQTNDEHVKSVLENLFYDILNIEFNLQNWIRTMCKYGDAFIRLRTKEHIGVYMAEPVSPYICERIEDYNEETGELIAVNFLIGGNKSKPIELYDMAHFRLLTDTAYLPYGRSQIEAARKVWKALILLEDAMLISRIMRAPERRIFKVHVGGLAPSEIDSYMQKFVDNIKKTPIIDRTTGDWNLRYNIENFMEDFYIPTRSANDGTTIDTLKGLEWDGTDDVEYMRKRMMNALKVPRAFIGDEGDIESKATLASQDIRFARTIEKLQKIIASELTKIAIVHLTLQGATDEQLVSFKISLTSPSIVYRQQKLELYNTQADLTEKLTRDSNLPKKWLWKNVWDFSDDEIEEIQQQIVEDAKQKFRITQIQNEGNDPMQTGKSFGTPHDLATVKDPNEKNADGNQTPDSDEENDDALAQSLNQEKIPTVGHKYHGGSPLSQEAKMLKEIAIRKTFQLDNEVNDYMNPSNIKDLD